MNDKPIRIGIITYHFSDNFGALLQAYALRKWFLEGGQSARFVNYHPAHVEEGAKLRISLSRQALKGNLKSIYLRASNFLHQHFGNPEQGVKFEAFRHTVLGITDPVIRDADSLASLAKAFDLLVTGSDQVWAPSVQFGFDPAYFLAFAKDSGVRKISYAPSFGKDSLPGTELVKLAPLLHNLSSISVRELSGLDIVASSAGLSATCVPDPTLLHTNYDELLRTSTDTHDGHIFCYALRTGEGIRDVAYAAADAYKAPIISPHNIHRRWRQIGKTVYPGPAEWLSQVANARFVVTNSFHGTVFSIVFRKPFLVVGLGGAKSAMNARSKNLLAQLGLLDRFIEASDAHLAHELFKREIDWNSVAIKQSELRQNGVDFLTKQISEINIT